MHHICISRHCCTWSEFCITVCKVLSRSGSLSVPCLHGGLKTQPRHLFPWFWNLTGFRSRSAMGRNALARSHNSPKAHPQHNLCPKCLWQISHHATKPNFAIAPSTFPSLFPAPTQHHPQTHSKVFKGHISTLRDFFFTVLR